MKFDAFRIVSICVGQEFTSVNKLIEQRKSKKIRRRGKFHYELETKNMLI